MNRLVLFTSDLLVTLSLVSSPLLADKTIIINNGYQPHPFVYEDRVYVPAREMSTVIGAQFRWGDGVFTLSYSDKDLRMTPYSRTGYYRGDPVTLAAYPVIIDDQLYVPVNTLRQFFGLEVRWDNVTLRLGVMGSSGWRNWEVRRPSWGSGPPPWAPAWGRRGDKGYDKDRSYSKSGDYYSREHRITTKAPKYKGKSAYRDSDRERGRDDDDDDKKQGWGKSKGPKGNKGKPGRGRK